MIPSLTGKQAQQRFTLRSVVLTSTSSRWRGTISGRPLPETRCSSSTDPSMPQSAALWPSPGYVLRQRLAIFSREYYEVLIATAIIVVTYPEG